MDYQQSLKNFNHLKSFVRARSFCRIFFFFKSVSEYDVEIYETERTYEQQSKIDVARAKSLPYAFISNDKNGEEVLYYHDQNVDIEYDLFGDIVITFDCYDHIDIKTIRQQFLLLINLLENK